MPTGRLMVLIALGYAGLCLIFLSLLAILCALFYWLSSSLDRAPALLLTGVAGLLPIVLGLLFVPARTAVHAPPIKLDLKSVITELGVALGREANEFAHQKPWPTVLIAGLIGFVAAANPKLVEQILKTLKPSS